MFNTRKNINFLEKVVKHFIIDLCKFQNILFELQDKFFISIFFVRAYRAAHFSKKGSTIINKKVSSQLLLDNRR